MGQARIRRLNAERAADIDDGVVSIALIAYRHLQATMIGYSNYADEVTQ